MTDPELIEFLYDILFELMTYENKPTREDIKKLGVELKKRGVVSWSIDD